MPEPSSSLRIPVTSNPPEPLETALSLLASSDLYAREAGAQLLAGQSDPEALRLIETACKDREERVVSGGLRALFASVAAGSPEAETVLLRLVTQNSRIRTLVKEGGADRFGALPPDGFTARQAQFILGNPDLARCRLAGLETGTFQQVQAYRSERLRANPAFAALFDVIRSDPELPRTLKAVLARRMEFLIADGVPRTLEPYWNDIRRMTGLFAGLSLEPALATLTETAIDRSVKREGAALWKRMAEEVLYVPELVIGSGAHSANFCSTLATLRPDRLPLVVEQRPRLGGQFASPSGAAWQMNSRCRPLSADRRSRPGTGEGLNSLGAYAPVQESDLTGQSYAPQSAIGQAIRLSLFLSAHALTGVRYIGYDINDVLSRKELGLPAEPAPGGRYLVMLQSVATGETHVLTTDTLIHTGGLGKPNVAFRDPKSLSAVKEEQARQMAGAMPRYLTFGDFMARLADPSIPFPLRGLEKVIVIGKGDSGKVAVEALLGYAPAVRNTVHSLDRVGEVIWIGQSSQTKEQFLACERSRYHPLAAEFPAADQSTRSSRVKPVPFRAERFMVEKDKAIVGSSTGVDYVADLVIDCTGFERRGTQRPIPLTRLEQTLRTGTRLRLCTEAGSEGDVVLKCQSVVRKGEGENRKVEMTGTVQRFVARYAASGVFSLSVDPCREEELGSILERTIQQTLGLSDTSPLYLRDTVLPVVYSTVNGTRTPLARSEVGKNVFYLGPQSGLPYLGSGSSKSGENAVALWRYAGEVTAFAEYYFANLFSQKTPFSSLTPAFVPHELPKARSRKGDDTPLSFPVTVEAAYEPLREMRRLLHYALCETLRGFRLPKQGETTVLPVTLLLRPSERAGEPLRLTVQTETSAIGGVSLRLLLESLGTEPLVQQAMLAYQEALPAGKRRMGSLPLHLEIRLRGGRLGLEGMAVRPFQLWTQARRLEAEERVVR
jgi:hypothetical protein